jgi:hypothetical protein
MDFHIDEDTLYSYQWTNATTSGQGYAVGDLDCDTTKTTVELDITQSEGNIVAVYQDPTPD